MVNNSIDTYTNIQVQVLCRYNNDNYLKSEMFINLFRRPENAYINHSVSFVISTNNIMIVVFTMNCYKSIPTISYQYFFFFSSMFSHVDIFFI